MQVSWFASSLRFERVAGLFALLAPRPLQYPGVWELALFNKLALTVTRAAYSLSG
jgi:hypothetical protein